MKYLIVDDTKMNRQIARDIILEELPQAIVTESSSGEEALIALMADDYDVILLDIVMPGIDGIETLKEMKDMPLKSKIVMYSSVDELDALALCFELGAVDFIHKPLDRIEFMARVKSVSRQKQLEDEMCEYVHCIKEQKDLILKTQMELLQKEKLASIGQLSAGVVAELNEPLSYISSDLFKLNDYMEGHQLYQGQGQAMETLIEEMSMRLRRMQDTINSLGNFAGTNPQEFSTGYDLNRGIRDVLTITHNKTRSLARVKVDYGNLPMIDGNPGQINQALFNFYVNTLEAIQLEDMEGLSTISIKTFVEDDFVCALLTESGLGHKAYTVPDTFTPDKWEELLEQEMKLTFDVIVNQHGGSIEVSENEDHEFSYKVRFPIHGEAAL